MRYRTILALTVLALACGQPFWKVPPRPSEPVFPPARAAVPIDSILLEHTACFGRCPIYAYMLRRTGAATYEGIRFTPVLGRYGADLDSVTFRRLERTVRAKHFFAMWRDYASAVTDQPSVITTAFVGDTVKRVDRYGVGEDAPFELREVEAAIEETGAALHWRYEGPSKDW